MGIHIFGHRRRLGINSPSRQSLFNARSIFLRKTLLNLDLS